MSKFKVKDLVGKHINEASKWCKLNGYGTRIASLSNAEEGFINTSKTDIKRVNIVISRFGYVLKAYLG